jgi:hypothetical protein
MFREQVDGPLSETGRRRRICVDLSRLSLHRKAVDPGYELVVRESM